MRPSLDSLAVTLLVTSTAAALLAVPEPTVPLIASPPFWGVLGAVVIFARLVVGRIRGGRFARAEHVTLAAFLFLMPTVYLASCALAGGGARWLAVELAGQLAFGALAIVGARRAPRLVGAGIVAHGLLWDAWHHGRGEFIPGWYVLACLLVDLGWGAYASSRAEAWRRSPRAFPDRTWRARGSAREAGKR